MNQMIRLLLLYSPFLVAIANAQLNGTTIPEGIWIEGVTPPNGFNLFYFSSTADEEVSAEVRAPGTGVIMRILDGNETEVFALSTNTASNHAVQSFCSAEFANRNGIRQVRMSSFEVGVSHSYEIRITTRRTLIIPSSNSSALYRTLVDVPHEPVGRYYVDVSSPLEPLRIHFKLIQFPNPMIDEVVKVNHGSCNDPVHYKNDAYRYFDHDTQFPIVFEFASNDTLSLGRYYVAVSIYGMRGEPYTYGIGACFGKNCSVDFSDSVPESVTESNFSFTGNDEISSGSLNGKVATHALIVCLCLICTRYKVV